MASRHPSSPSRKTVLYVLRKRRTECFFATAFATLVVLFSVVTLCVYFQISSSSGDDDTTTTIHYHRQKIVERITHVIERIPTVAPMKVIPRRYNGHDTAIQQQLQQQQHSRERSHEIQRSFHFVPETNENIRPSENSRQDQAIKEPNPTVHPKEEPQQNVDRSDVVENQENIQPHPNEEQKRQSVQDNSISDGLAENQENLQPKPQAKQELQSAQSIQNNSEYTFEEHNVDGSGLVENQPNLQSEQFIQDNVESSMEKEQKNLRTIQNTFPIHVGNDLEEILNPGVLFSKHNDSDVFLQEHDLPRTLQVPNFWNPIVFHGEHGVRSYLGDGGKRLMTPEEAHSIGSFYPENNNNHLETILVSIASYRDPECGPTIEDLYLRAAHPERIRVSVIDQRAKEDPICAQPTVNCTLDPNQTLCKYKHLIDVFELPARFAVGPVFARHLSNRMYRGEYFTMQVDAHVRFVQGWDDDIINQWKSANNEMAILSVYLSDVADSIDPITHERLRQTRPIMCDTDYEDHGRLKHIRHRTQPEDYPTIHGSPTIHPFWAAGFSFGRGHFVVQVPYDQYLPMVFQGEEISMGVRGFTYGYDYYSPEKSILFHIYAAGPNTKARESVRKYWEDNAVLYGGVDAVSMKRLNGIIGMGEPNDEYFHVDETKYGLGNVRTAEKFFRTFGIHTDTETVEHHLCNFVGKPMQDMFIPWMRADGMGIDYSKVDFEYIDPESISNIKKERQVHDGEEQAVNKERVLNENYPRQQEEQVLQEPQKDEDGNQQNDKERERNQEPDQHEAFLLAVQKLRNEFPVHVGDDMEEIEHPGLLFTDQELVPQILNQHNISRTVKVPRFWAPSANGRAGIRSYLGDGGNRLMTLEEAHTIGSFTSDSQLETIFVAVTSYRDPECGPTVEDIFLRANHPERIRVVIVDQRTDDDPVCSQPVVQCTTDPNQALCKYQHLIDSFELAAPLSIGPAFARHLANRMYRGEYFVLQVDSHVRFVENWDDSIIRQWQSTNNEMAVLSVYLEDIIGSIDEVTHKVLTKNIPLMCKTEYEGAGKRRHLRHGQQPLRKADPAGNPTLHPFWAAGFSFARGHFLVQVPYDQYLPMIFQGEEINIGLRAFTYGYDFYAPATPVAFHIYAMGKNKAKRKNVKLFWENQGLYPGSGLVAMKRLNGIIGMSDEPNEEYYNVDEELYGLGHVREKEKFFRTYGIHTETHTVENGLCNFVGKPMEKMFTPFLRKNGLGIDYSKVDYEFVDPANAKKVNDNP